jgi:hypothetical protein
MQTLVFNHQSAVQEETSNRAIYQTVVADFQALPADQLVAVNIDPNVAVLAVLGALPRIRTHRDALATLPGFNVERFDKLEAYAGALRYAHRVFQLASEPPDILKNLQEEASQLRDLLFKDVTVAIARNLIAKEKLDDLKGANGYKNTANDLDLLVGVLQDHWAQVQGKVGTTEQELEYAERLSHHLLRVFGVRENGPEGIAEVSEMRTRAFTVFSKTYEGVRQALAYLRRDIGDADKIAPSFYLARNAAKKNTEQAPEAEGTGTTAAGTAAHEEPTQVPPGATAQSGGAPGVVNPADPFAP